MTVTTREVSLDPIDFDAIRALGHRMVDDMVDHVADARDRRVWTPPSDSALEFFARSMPERGEGPEAAYAEFLQHILPFALGNTHPRFWGWVLGSGTLDGALAEFLCATMNSSASGLESSATRLEAQVVRWFLDLYEWPENASGIVSSSGSMSNFIALVVARDAMERRHGGEKSRLHTFYCSDQTHNSVEKALMVCGVGAERLRKVATDARCKVDLVELERVIQADRDAGFTPACIVGNVGTVNTGAIDDLDALEQIARRNDMWLHLDGAFGAIAWLDPRYRERLDVIRRADSLAFDLHKWMHVPYDAAMVLIRDGEAHRRTFTPSAGAYLASLPGGLNMLDAEHDLYRRSIDLSRPGRALKIWFGLRTHGLDTYRASVAMNIDQAAGLAARLESEPEFEVVAPVEMNIVCFRYHPHGIDDVESLDELNRALIIRLHESGVAVPSGTTLDGRFVIRVAIANHRTRTSDLELFVDTCITMGRELLETMQISRAVGVS